jgi:CheY-like chemotaxis protein
LTILVAESDPADALLLEQGFFCAGVHSPVTFVDDGQEAMDYLRGAPPFQNRAAHPLPSLLVMELNLPRRSGYDVLKWLQCQPPAHRMLIVVLSSCSRPEDIDRAYALGADAYVLKPADAGELTDVARHLKNYWLETNA